MPVNFNEPLSMLQRITEDFEYYKILDKAAAAETTEEQVALVAAFSVSSYASTLIRTTKPFNPLLGETYDLDRVDEMGLRLIVEQGNFRISFDSGVKKKTQNLVFIVNYKLSFTSSSLCCISCDINS